MCKTCSCSSDWLPGPGEVASALLGVAADSAASKISRKVLFFGVAVPMLPFAVWGLFGWWTIAIVALLAAGSVAGLVLVRRLAVHSVVVRPEPTPEMRLALAARGLKPIPAPGQARPALPRARPALPRNLSIGRGRQALPAAAHEFVPLDWDKGCGHLAHPQATRCFLPAQAHPSKAIEPGRVIPAAAKALPAGRVECGKCDSPIVRSASSGLWWAIDGLGVATASACAHEPRAAVPVVTGKVVPAPVKARTR